MWLLWGAGEVSVLILEGSDFRQKAWRREGSILHLVGLAFRVEQSPALAHS